ncbi:hypothetical protein Q8A67_019089 [Cirrhinus molitorella]|uniref:Uncharacterized protein n=1 Tax=Cirrhinus molitorella TaxID=172907 RepID=A0AA88P958_9TELE|nr:hypothetical protein Q8A67_019089 [Cirrhinus molitorella]
MNPQVRTLSESRLRARWCGLRQAKSRSNQGCAAQLELPTAASHTRRLAKEGLTAQLSPYLSPPHLAERRGSLSTQPSGLRSAKPAGHAGSGALIVQESWSIKGHA